MLQPKDQQERGSTTVVSDAQQMMEAIEIAEPGPPSVLRLVQRPVPQPGPGELLVRISAAGVNRPDVQQRRGKYAPPAGVTDIPGLEFSGRIEALGAGVTGWKIGDTVAALVSGGGYAQYCTVPAEQALPIPAGLDMIQAAALPETCFTVWRNLFDIGGLQAGETMLVHGGTSGIGTTAIQMARLFGAEVIATAGSPEKCAACLELGAAHAIDYKTQDFVALVQQATGGRGVDLILDMIGGDYLSRNLQTLAFGGRHVSIATQRGSRVEVDLGLVMRKRLTLTGSHLRSRPISEKAAIARALLERVWPAIEAGRLRPRIHAVFPLAQAEAAHVAIDSGDHIGKIILRCD
jgi:putative PIG3 family NAD(P)H quinone oxidoreductase